MKTKVCNICYKRKEIKRFYFRDARCKKCNLSLRKQKRHANPELARQHNYRNYRKRKLKARDADLRRMYGITLEQYSQIKKNQNNVCAICDSHQTDPKRSLCVDHCHATGKVRGLVCDKCNRAIGLLNDNPAIADRLSTYLRGQK